MDVIGDGFLARYLSKAFVDRHPHATAIAAGVTKTSVVSTEDFDREASLVYRVVQQCRARGRTVVFFSTASDSMYGAPESPGREDGPVYPTTPYGRHKLALESVLANSGSSWLVLRLSHVVGHRQQPHQLVPALSSQIRSGVVTVYRNTYRDLLDVRDMMVALDGLLARSATEQVVNVASGFPEHIANIVTQIERRVGVHAHREMVDSANSRTTVSTSRLRAVVPEWNDIGFGRHYVSGLLDNYVGPVREPVPVLGTRAASAADGV